MCSLFLVVAIWGLYIKAKLIFVLIHVVSQGDTEHNTHVHDRGLFLLDIQDYQTNELVANCRHKSKDYRANFINIPP